MILDIVLLFFSFPFLISLSLASISWYYYHIWKLKRIMPPGPWPLPFVGNILTLRKVKGPIHEKLWKLSEIYGDPFTFWFGKSRAVVVTKKETVREVLIKKQHIYCSRPPIGIAFRRINEGSMDIVLGQYGPAWRMHRKVASRSIRSLIGAGSLERRAVQVVREAVDRMTKQDEPVDMARHLMNIIANIICYYAYGQQYELHDREFERLQFIINQRHKTFIRAAVWEALPLSEYLPLTRIPDVRKVLDLIEELIEMSRSKIAKHRESYEEGVIRDFIDAMIAEQDQLKLEEKDDLLLNDMHIMMVLMDVFNAGIDTTQTTLTWFFLFMILNPDIQERCYQEISDNIGDKEVVLSDSTRLPFVQACIWETLRMRMPAPMNLPHVNIVEDKIGPYTIPVDTSVFANLYAMSMDPEGDFKDNVSQFDPVTHFMRDGELDREQGTKMLPFGGGRRVCLGEQLARNDLFLVATSLLQMLKFTAAPGQTYMTDHDPSVGMGFHPRHYTLLVQRR